MQATIAEEGSSDSEAAASEDGATNSQARATAGSVIAPQAGDDTPVPLGRRKASLGKRGTVFVPAIAGLSELNVQGLREIFGLFDLEGSGKVSPMAVRAAASSAGLERENPEVFRLISGLASEEPVDFEEFVKLVSDPIGDRNSKAGVSRLLGLLGPDAASKGSVGVDDLQRLADDLGLDLDTEDLEDLIEKAGAGPDGRLGLDAFYAVMAE
mmetsp:Transcript_119280/g.371579  ORF Transcript_119280/g.371579 Transcript_119280/m.371579 type:complete len:212 (+) Transcript_119280:92-727(+)